MSIVKTIYGGLRAGGESMIDAATNETKTPYKVQYPPTIGHWEGWNKLFKEGKENYIYQVRIVGLYLNISDRN